MDALSLRPVFHTEEIIHITYYHHRNFDRCGVLIHFETNNMTILMNNTTISMQNSCHDAKIDFGGIRTHAQKTAALTQRLRPLGHEVNVPNRGLEPRFPA